MALTHLRAHGGQGRPVFPRFGVHTLGLCALIALLSSTPGPAEDAPQWLDRFHVAWGLDAPPAALVEYRGDLIAAGSFTCAGSIKLSHVGRWDGATWHPMGDGLDGQVRALAVIGDSLFAGGAFTHSGNRQVLRLARWDGDSWQSVGGGLDGPCFALAVNGDTLVAGGRFERAGGTSIPKMAAWANGAWHGVASTENEFEWIDVTGLAVADGTIFATWSSTPPEHQGPDDVPYAIQNGFFGLTHGRWTEPGYLTPEFSFTPRQLAVLDGQLVAAGSTHRYRPGVISFNSAVARLTGPEWEILGGELGERNLPNAMGVARGRIVIAQADAVRELNGSTWKTIEGSPRRADCFAEYRGNLVIGGDFPSAGGVPAREIAVLDGITWRACGSEAGDGIEGTVHSLVPTSWGMHAGQIHWWAGSFQTPGCRTWDGFRWNDLPLPTDRLPAPVVEWRDLLVAGSVAEPCGDYGTSCSGLGAWDGNEWVMWDDMAGAKIGALLSQDSRLVVAGQLPGVGGGGQVISAWDGAAWSSLDGDLAGTVMAMTSFHGDPIAWGFFGTDSLPAAGRAARWNGESWELLAGNSPFRVRAATAFGNHLVAAWDDRLYLEYDTRPVSGVSRWIDGGWSPVGDPPNHPVRALAVFHGALIAGGDFTHFGTTEARGLARWDGTAWQPYAGGVGGSVTDLEVRGDSLWVGGSFRFAGGVPSFNVGVYIEPSPSPVSLIASGRDSLIALDFRLPQDADVAGAVLRFSRGDYPSDPHDGEPVPGGVEGRFPGNPGASVHLDLSARKTAAGSTAPPLPIRPRERTPLPHARCG